MTASKSAFQEYKLDLTELIKAYRAIMLSDAFINILSRKVDNSVLQEYKLDSLLSKVVKVYPDAYIKDLFFVRLVTLLEEYLKNRLIQEFLENEIAVKNFLLNYNTDRKITTTDVIDGPQRLALNLIEEIIFHNLPKVERIYFATFKFDIKKFCNFKTLVMIVKIRHLLVHNGGKTKKKEKIETYSLQTCLNNINKLIENIEFFIKHKRIKKIIKSIDIDGFDKDIFKMGSQDLLDYKILKAFGE